MYARRKTEDGRRNAIGRSNGVNGEIRLASPVSRLPRHQGFTLMEVLLAITLLGIIMVLAYQGLRTGAATAASGEEAIERVNRLRLTQEFVRGQISRAQPIPFEQDETIGGVVFEGGPEALRFAGPMPGYLSFGGPYVQTLALVNGDDGVELIFEHRVLTYGPDADAPPEEDEREPVTLISGLKDARFSYLAPPESENGEPEWVEEWNLTESLPLLVRLEGEFREGRNLAWPLLAVAPRVDGGGRTGSRGLQFGPGPPPTERGRQ